MHKTLSIATLALSTVICGCGTMASFHNSSPGNPARPFGGVANDFDAIFTGDALGLIDLPGSLVADVVTLPDVLVANAYHKRTSESLPHELRDGEKTEPAPDQTRPE